MESSLEEGHCPTSRKSTEESHKVNSMWHLSYAERLKETKLYTLEQRRLRGDLIETFKILNDLEGINKGKLFNTNPHHDKNRCHSFKLYKEALKKGLSCRSKLFSVRVVSTWNNLPARVVEVKTINQFISSKTTGMKMDMGS